MADLNLRLRIARAKRAKELEAAPPSEPSMGPFINDTRPVRRESNAFDPVAQALLGRDVASVRRDAGKFVDQAGTAIGDVALGAQDILTAGYGDEASGALKTLLMGGDLGENVEAERARLEGADPRLRLAGSLVGGAMLPAPKVPTAGNMAKTSGGYGAAYGSGSGNTLEERLTGAGVGGLTGVAGGYALGKIGGALSTSKTKAPSVADLKQQAATAYAKADAAGDIVPNSAFKSMVKDMEREMIKFPMDKGLHPKAARVLKRFRKVDDAVSFEGMRTFRRLIGNVAGSTDPQERAIGMKMRDILDDFMGSLRGGPAFKEATDAWRRMSKTTTIDKLIATAKDNSKSLFGGSGLDGALRTQFRQLANNERRMRMFTAEEQQAIRDVARGSFGENVIRFFGKFAPSTPLYMTPHAMAGVATGDFAVPAGMFAAGGAARNVAGRQTLGRANLARDFAAVGASPRTANTLSPLQQALLRAAATNAAALPNMGVTETRSGPRRVRAR